MSMRKLLVQYIGSTLCLPELEREVKEIAIRDKDFQLIQMFVPERMCSVTSEEYDDLLEYTSTRFSCGHYTIGAAAMYNYCPECGAKVVEP